MFPLMYAFILGDFSSVFHTLFLCLWSLVTEGQMHTLPVDAGPGMAALLNLSNI